jgi:hypothetical protein
LADGLAEVFAVVLVDDDFIEDVLLDAGLGDGFVACLVDFIEDDVTFADGFGLGEAEVAAMATPVVRNADASIDARIFFIVTPPFVA